MEGTIEQLFDGIKQALAAEAQQPGGPTLTQELVVYADFSKCPVLGKLLEVKGELRVVVRHVPVAAIEADRQQLSEQMAGMRAACGAA
jgi:hypothetical protein